MTTPVSFELAKLLKDKGFDESIDARWYYDYEYLNYKLSLKGVIKWNPKEDSYPAPTIAEVVMWLYEKHEIWIEITMGKDHTGIWFDWDIFSTILPRKDDELGEESVEYEDNPNEKWLNYKTTYNSMIEDERFVIINKESYSSPTEAYEAAIEYTLNNLI